MQEKCRGNAGEINAGERNAGEMQEKQKQEKCRGNAGEMQEKEVQEKCRRNKCSRNAALSRDKGWGKPSSLPLQFHLPLLPSIAISTTSSHISRWSKCHYQLEIPRNNPVAISPLPPKFAAEWGKGRISALASPLLAPAALGSLGCFCSSAFQVKLSEDKTRTGENREGGKAHQHSSLMAQVRLTGGN